MVVPTGTEVTLRACLIWAMVNVQPSAPPDAADWVSRELALATEANDAPPLICARYWVAWAEVSVTSTLTQAVV